LASQAVEMHLRQNSSQNMTDEELIAILRSEGGEHSDA
jgi:hypothetical protein